MQEIAFRVTIKSIGYYEQRKQRKECLAKDISPRQVLGVLNGGDHLVHGEKGRQVCSVWTEIDKLDDFDYTWKNWWFWLERQSLLLDKDKQKWKGCKSSSVRNEIFIAECKYGKSEGERC